MADDNTRSCEKRFHWQSMWNAWVKGPEIKEITHRIGYFVGQISWNLCLFEWMKCTSEKVTQLSKDRYSAGDNTRIWKKWLQKHSLWHDGTKEVQNKKKIHRIWYLEGKISENVGRCEYSVTLRSWHSCPKMTCQNVLVRYNENWNMIAVTIDMIIMGL